LSGCLAASVTGFFALRRVFGLTRSCGASRGGEGRNSTVGSTGCNSRFLRMDILGIQPCRETVITYFGSTVPSSVRAHEHNATMAMMAQIDRNMSSSLRYRLARDRIGLVAGRTLARKFRLANTDLIAPFKRLERTRSKPKQHSLAKYVASFGL